MRILNVPAHHYKCVSSTALCPLPSLVENVKVHGDICIIVKIGCFIEYTKLLACIFPTLGFCLISAGFYYVEIEVLV